MKQKNIVHSASTSELSPRLPIYQEGKISLKKLSCFMGITPETLALIINRDIRTIGRDTVSKALMKRIQPLIYALSMLFELTDCNQAEVERWLSEPIPEWFDYSPIKCLEEGNIQAVVNLVKRIYYADSSGY